MVFPLGDFVMVLPSSFFSMVAGFGLSEGGVLPCACVFSAGSVTLAQNSNPVRMAGVMWLILILPLIKRPLHSRDFILMTFASVVLKASNPHMAFPSWRWFLERINPRPHSIVAGLMVRIRTRPVSPFA